MQIVQVNFVFFLIPIMFLKIKLKNQAPKIVTDNSKIVIIHSSIVCSTSGEAPAIPRTTITGNEDI